MDCCFSDPTVLCSLEVPIVPNQTNTLEQKINSIIRLFIIFIIMFFLLRYYSSIENQNTFLISIIILLFILLLYCITSKGKEYFEMSDFPTQYKYPLIKNEKARQKMSLPPLIFPRSHDRDVWSAPSYRHSAVNYDNMRYDFTDEFIEIPQKENYRERDPRLRTYTQFSLENIDKYCSQDKNGSKILKNREKLPVIPEETAEQIQEQIPEEPPFSQNYGRNETSLRERFDNTSQMPQNQAPLQKNNEIITENITPLSLLKKELPDQSLLIPKQPENIYGDDDITDQDRERYFQNIQPNRFSYNDTAEPINANLGISYTPSLPPRVIDQLASQEYSEPLYHRVDPQLVREGGIPKERLEELPRRTDWSSKYSFLDAQPGSVDIDEIYDPKYQNYGDQYRSYGDVNLGQIQYYYSDIENIKRPNFITRSKVDFMTYTDPMGKELPEYVREVSLHDIKKDVHDQYTSDNLYFREDLMERQMRRRNSEDWQLRNRPIRRNANTMHFKSNY